MENLVYALVQVVHNFGAAAIVGSGAAALWLARENECILKKLAVLAAIGWVAQGISGAGFGATSYYYYGEFPDIHGIAVASLLLKMACAAVGFMLAVFYFKSGSQWTPQKRHRVWHSLFGLGVLALTAAAFLRWFS